MMNLEQLLARDCAAQHFGMWMIEPGWAMRCVSMVKSGGWAFRAQEPGEPSGDAQEHAEGAIGIVPIVGPIAKGDSSLGGTSSIRTRQAVRAFARDADTKAIMLHIDSPGGTVAGTAELADDIAAANTIKPVFAHIEDLGASAAFWAASQARRITANASAEVGSIGTVAIIEDTSKAAEAAGIEVHVISTGPLKAGLAPGAPISDEALEDAQRRVDAQNAFFFKAVQNGRGLDKAQMAAVSTGQVFIAAEAKKLGLIDKVASFEQALADAVKAITPRRRQAAAQRVRMAELG